MLKTSPLKRGLVALALALPLSHGAAAGIPQTDWANLAEAITSNVQKAITWANRLSLRQSEMDTEAENAELKVDTWNNGFANATARLNQQLTDLYNLALAKSGAPAQYACAPYSVSIQLEDMLLDRLCDEEERSRGVDQETLAGSPALAAALGLEVDPDAEPQAPRERTPTSELDPSAIAGLLGLPLSHDERAEKAVRDMIDITYPTYRPDPTKTDFMDYELAHEMGEIIRHNTPSKLIHGIAAKRVEHGGVSEAGLLDALAQDQFSIERIAHLLTRESTQDQLWRERLLSKSFRVWRSVQEYEQSLEQEFIAAIRLLEAMGGDTE